jgi:hypothetical protein
MKTILLLLGVLSTILYIYFVMPVFSFGFSGWAVIFLIWALVCLGIARKNRFSGFFSFSGIIGAGFFIIFILNTIVLGIRKK